MSNEYAYVSYTEMNALIKGEIDIDSSFLMIMAQVTFLWFQRSRISVCYSLPLNIMKVAIMPENIVENNQHSRKDCFHTMVAV